MYVSISSCTVSICTQNLWNLTNKYYDQNMQQKLMFNWAFSTRNHNFACEPCIFQRGTMYNCVCQKYGQGLMSYYKLQKLNIIYFWNCMSLLLSFACCLCMWQKNLLSFCGKLLLELVSFSLIHVYTYKQLGAALRPQSFSYFQSVHGSK